MKAQNNFLYIFKCIFKRDERKKKEENFHSE